MGQLHQTLSVLQNSCLSISFTHMPKLKANFIGKICQMPFVMHQVSAFVKPGDYPIFNP